MLQILSDNFSHIKLTSCDLNKYHNVDIDFHQLDLSDPSKYIYFPVNDLLICLDVLEHLDKSFIEDVLKYFSVISKNSILTVANHSDIIDGIELHTIREDDSYWTPLISKYFTIHRINEHYHQFGKPLLYIYYLTSNNINT
jgi:chemotaxis methyl-accepting protein methylase